MPGMIPDKKSIQEIERDYEDLLIKHNRLIESWLKARLEAHHPAEQDCKTDSIDPFYIVRFD